MPAEFCQRFEAMGRPYYVQFVNPKDRANLGPCTDGEPPTQEEFTELDLERQCVLADDASIALHRGIVSYYAEKSSGSVAAAQEQCG